MAALSSFSMQGFEYVYAEWAQLEGVWDGSSFAGLEWDLGDLYLEGSSTYTLYADAPDGDPNSLGGSVNNYFGTCDIVATTADAILVYAPGGDYYYLLSNVPQTSFPLTMVPYDGTNSQFVGPLTPCFARGTMIATPEGDRAVEALTAGDRVMTAEGRSVEVRWVGHKKRHARFARRAGDLPVLIRRGALGEGLPRRDLYVSPDHAMLVDGVLVHALALVNGVSIVHMKEWREENVEYFHIELENHELIFAEGAPTETFVDNISRTNFDNYEEYVRLFGEGSAVPELPLPRVKTRRQLSSRTKTRLMGIAMNSGQWAA